MSENPTLSPVTTAGDDDSSHFYPFLTTVECVCGRKWQIRCGTNGPHNLVAFHCSCGHVSGRVPLP